MPRLKLKSTPRSFATLIFLGALGNFAMALPDDKPLEFEGAFLPSERAANRLSATIDQSIKSISEAELSLKRREAELELRETSVNKSREELAQMLTYLVRAEEELQRLLNLASEASEADILKVTELYQNMKPKEAAEVFAVMDPSLAAGFLSRMNVATASRILEQLEPEASYAIGAILAGKNVRLSPSMETKQ